MNLGASFALGITVSQDLAQAMKWYHMAAKQGEAVAQRNLGLMHMFREWDEKHICLRWSLDDIFLPDLLEALKWFRLAAEQGNAQAQVLASLTNAQVLAKKANRKNREDVHDDDFKKWWDLTINQNQQNGRSFSYARSPFNDTNNEGIDHLDYQCLWALTAGQRHTLARFNLGNGYDNGEGVLKSKVEVPTSTNVETGNEMHESDNGADEKDDDSVYGAPFLYERKASSGMGAVLEIARNRGVLGDEAVASGRMYACPAT